MTKLPCISGKDCLRALQKKGFYLSHQKGSHMVVRRDHPPCRTTVPNHKELTPGTLRAILRQTGLSVEEFVSLL